MGIFSFLFGKTNYVPEGKLTLQDSQEVKTGWQKVEEQASLGKPSNLKSAVIDADKLMDFVLRKMYPSLEATGERLKAAKVKFVGKWEIYDGLWFAHKVRNEIVHNVNFELPSSQVRDILEKFKAGLIELGGL
ncbi:MAG TPA: hypothetical protein VIH52_03100 [Candidatus Nanoarchaeia archaeon]|nr:hypothetical protein [uncultured archaeon]